VTVARRILKGYENHPVPSEHVPTRREEARKKFAWLLDAAAVNSWRSSDPAGSRRRSPTAILTKRTMGPYFFNRTYSPFDSRRERMTTAIEVFNKLAEGIATGNGDALIDLCADDVVFEFPFAPEGRPTRVEGKAAVGEYLKTLSGHVRLEGVTALEIHETVKPELAIIEMTMTGTVAATGAPFEQSYVSFLTVRDGLVANYRDYWNPLKSADWNAA